MIMFVGHLLDENELQIGGQLEVLNKILSFYLAPDPNLKKGSKPLNATLGGYLNKIISFWLIKRPQILLKYFTASSRRSLLIDSMFNHLYLSHCVTDLLVRLCTVATVPPAVDICEYNDMRNDVL